MLQIYFPVAEVYYPCLTSPRLRADTPLIFVTFPSPFTSQFKTPGKIFRVSLCQFLANFESEHIDGSQEVLDSFHLYNCLIDLEFIDKHYEADIHCLLARGK